MLINAAGRNTLLCLWQGFVLVMQRNHLNLTVGFLWGLNFLLTHKVSTKDIPRKQPKKVLKPDELWKWMSDHWPCVKHLSCQKPNKVVQKLYKAHWIYPPQFSSNDLGRSWLFEFEYNNMSLEWPFLAGCVWCHSCWQWFVNAEREHRNLIWGFPQGTNLVNQPKISIHCVYVREEPFPIVQCIFWLPPVQIRN